MARQAITFDFHNTLVRCDEWFDLEVRDLPAAFVRWHAERHGPLSLNRSVSGLERSYRALRRSIIDHGHELRAERCLAVVLDQAGTRLDPGVLEEGVHALMSNALAHASVVPGAAETVHSLSERDLELGVVSSAVFHPFLEWALEQSGIRDRFRVVVTSASCGYYKSRPEIYWEALAALGAVSHQSLHIGDSLRFDVGGAARAGMRTVWLDHESTRPVDVEPDLTLRTLVGSSQQIVDLLNSP